MAEVTRLITWKRAAFATVIVALVAWAGFELVLRSDWFEEQLRLRVVAELEQATGAEIRLQSLNFEPVAKSMELTNLTLTAPGQVEPFVELPHTTVGFDLLSLIFGGAHLDSLSLRQPTVTLEIAEDGSTNWPPDLGRAGDSQLADIGLGRLTVEEATLIFNGEPYDLGFVAEDVELVAEAVSTAGCYALQASTGEVSGTPEGHYDVDSLASELELCGAQLTVHSLELDTLAWGALQGSGSVGPVNDPIVDFDFSWEMPLAQVPVTLPDGWALDGVLEGSGSVGRSPTRPIHYEGSLQSGGIAAMGPAGDVSGIRLGADFSGDLDQLLLSNLVVSAAAGAIEGQATVADLRGTPVVNLTGQVVSVRVDAFARTLLPTLPFASVASGPFELSASESTGVVLSSELTLVDPDDPDRDGMTGSASFEYASRTDRLRLQQLDLAIDGVALSAQGVLLHNAASNLTLDIRADSSSDIEMLWSLYSDEPLPIPVTISGATHVSLVADSPAGINDWAAMSVEATLAMDGVALNGSRWNTVSATISLIDQQLTILNGQLHNGRGSIAFSGSTAVSQELELEAWPFSLHATINDVDVAPLIAAAGIDADITGLVSGTVDIAGPLTSPSGEAQLSAATGSFKAQAFDVASGHLAYRAGRIAATDLVLTRGDARLSGSGSYTLPRREFSVAVAGGGVNLQDLSAIAGPDSPTSGTLSFDATATGRLALSSASRTFDAVSLDGSWAVAALTYGDLILGDWTGDAKSDSDRIDLTLTGEPLNGTVTGAGVIDAETLTFSSDVRFTSLDIGPLLRSGDDRGGPAGLVTGEAQFQGALDSLGDSTGVGAFSDLRLTVAGVPGSDEGYELFNPFPMRWRFADGQLNLDHMRLQGVGTNLELTGAIGVGEDVESDLRIDGDFELMALRELRPEFTTSGRSTIGVRLTGAISDPEIEGEWTIQDGSIESEGFPAGLNAINGQVMFVGREIRIEQMRALSGGGTLTLFGGGRLNEDGYEFRLDGSAESVRVRYPRGITSLVDGNFVLSGGGEQRLLSGEVVVQRLSTLRTTTLGSLLAELRSRTPTASQAAPLDSIQINVHVASAPGVEISTSLIRNVAAGIDLRLVGSLGNPSLLGQIDISQGQMTFHGSRYAINRGQIEFRNPVRIEPLLDFEMETRMRGVDIALILAGPARRLNLSYRSDPPLSFSELVNLVAVGRDPSSDPLYSLQQRIEQQSLFQTGANNVVANAVQSPVSPGLQRFFGVSRLKVDPGVGGADSNPAARISTEQQLADDVTLIYTYDLSSTQQQTLRLEWTPDRRWTFVLVRDENGLVGSDAIYKLRRP